MMERATVPQLLEIMAYVKLEAEAADALRQKPEPEEVQKPTAPRRAVRKR